MSGGRGTVTGIFAAFPAVMVTTTGRRTGRPHTVPPIAVIDPEAPGRIGLIASDFGQGHDPDWCHNLRASPEAVVEEDGVRRRYRAEDVTGERDERWCARGADIHLGYGG